MTARAGGTQAVGAVAASIPAEAQGDPPADDLPADDGMPSIRHKTIKEEIVSLGKEMAQLKDHVQDIKNDTLTEINTIKEIQ